ncbi:HPr family phosphocarrier protein [Clostridiaceae bacterium]|nr:HPr family phosphocarrier protein [Clostridiaceae bacterium]RKI10193.1 HPr family phosphocarrier protein [bacterium 1XD21-70]
MQKKTITIGLSTELEVRPVAMLVQIASQYESAIYVEEQNARVNAKSIMGMMTLGMKSGDVLTISADGTDELAAMEEIEGYLLGAN